MGNVSHQSTLLRMGFYREIPVDRVPPAKKTDRFVLNAFSLALAINHIAGIVAFT